MAGQSFEKHVPWLKIVHPSMVETVSTFPLVSGSSYIFQVSWKSVQGSRSCGGRKSPSPIDKARGLYNSLYYRTSHDCCCIDRLSGISSVWVFQGCHFSVQRLCLVDCDVLSCVLQVVKGLLKFWPKTCSQKEVVAVILLSCGTVLA